MQAVRRNNGDSTIGIVDAAIFQHHKALPPAADTDLHDIMKMDIFCIGSIGTDPIIASDCLYKFSFRQFVIAVADPQFFGFGILFHAFPPSMIAQY